MVRPAQFAPAEDRAFVEFFIKDNAFLRGLENVKQKFQSIGNFFTKVGLASALTARYGLAPVVKEFVAFDDAMLAIKATGDLTAIELDLVRDRARELGLATGYTAVQVANLMLELARAGFVKPDAIDSMTTAILNLARATGTELPVATEVMNNTLKSFGMGADQAAHVADALTVTANATFNSVTDLTDALRYAAAPAKAFGLSLEDTLAIIGKLGDVGVKGELAGTALRRIVSMVGSSGADLQRIFGVMNADAAGNLRNVVDVLDDIFLSLKNLPQAQQFEKLHEFFQILGMNPALIIGSNARSIRELRQEILAADRTAAAAAETMNSGLGGGLRRLLAAVENTAIAFGESLAPVLKVVAQLADDASRQVKAFVAENPILAQSIAVVTVAALAGGISLLGLGLAFKAAAVAIGVFTGTAAVLSALFGALTSGPALVAAGLAALAAQTEVGRRAWVSMASDGAAWWARFSATVREAMDAIVTAIGKGDLNAAIEVVTAGLELAWATVVERMTRAWFDFKDLFGSDLYKVQAFFELVCDAFAQAWEALIPTLRALWSDFVKFMKATFEVLGVVVGAFVKVAMLAPPMPLIRALLPALEEFRDRLKLEIEDRAAMIGADARLARDKALAEKKAKLDAAKEEFDAAVGAAKAEGFGGGGDLGPDVAPMPREVRPAMAALLPTPSQVRGAFSILPGFGGARMQFGYGDKFQKNQLDALNAIKDGKGGLPAEIGKAVGERMAFK